jgi:RHS repeat-associated protein
MHSWKTASGGSQPERSFLSRLKASPGLRFNVLRGGNTEGRLDAENRLVSVTITATGHRSEIGYDGLGRRVQIQELDPDTTQTLQVTSDKKYLWDGVEIAEERDTTGGIVQKRFYSQGFVDTDGTILFYTRDHLGSIRELTDGTQAIRARYDYDPYGRMTKTQGDKDSPFTYTGHFWHAQSDLDLTLFRAYDPNLGRWISRDPIGEFAGNNLYAYVANSPTVYLDRLGLDKTAYLECMASTLIELDILYDILNLTYAGISIAQPELSPFMGLLAGATVAGMPQSTDGTAPFAGGATFGGGIAGGIGGFGSFGPGGFGSRVSRFTPWSNGLNYLSIIVTTTDIIQKITKANGKCKCLLGN